MNRLIICKHNRIYYDFDNYDYERFMSFELECSECKQTYRIIVTPTQQTVHVKIGEGRML